MKAKTGEQCFVYFVREADSLTSRLMTAHCLKTKCPLVEQEMWTSSPGMIDYR